MCAAGTVGVDQNSLPGQTSGAKGSVRQGPSSLCRHPFRRIARQRGASLCRTSRPCGARADANSQAVAAEVISPPCARHFQSSGTERNSAPTACTAAVRGTRRCDQHAEFVRRRSEQFPSDLNAARCRGARGFALHSSAEMVFVHRRLLCPGSTVARETWSDKPLAMVRGFDARIAGKEH